MNPFRIRLLLLASLVLVGFGVLLLRLYDIQVREHDYYVNQLPGRSHITVRVPGVRGEIKDRNGVTLVENRAQFEVAFDLKEIEEDYRKTHGGSVPLYHYQATLNGQPDDRKEVDIVEIVKETVMPELAELGLAADFNASQLRIHFRSTGGLVPYTYRRDLTFQEFARFAENSLEIPGVTVSAKASRNYRFDSLACHLLGYVNLPDIGQVPAEKRREYNLYIGDDFGVHGLEKTMDHYLQGTPGRRTLERDEKGKIVGEVGYVEPRPGADVYLTIDARVQMITEEALRKIGRGAAVVMDPRSGDILAMASVPSFNPNVFIPSVGLEDWNRYTRDPTSPMFNRAINAYSPGSTCKVPVAFAGCLDGTDRHHFYCAGGVQYGSKFMKCWVHSKGYSHGSIDLSSALKTSCNAYFYQYANATGIGNLQTMMDKLGLGRPTGIEIAGESGGLVPGPEWLRMQGLTWTDAFTALVSIGQGAMEATPLQMASVTCTTANGGLVYRPRLVHKVQRKDGEVLMQKLPELRFDIKELGLSDDQVENVKRGMWRVVNESGGTAQRASSEVATLSGKTGTTQTGNPREPTNAWFIAFAPYEEPELAVCVFVQNGKSGGGAASPIAKKIIEEAIAMKNGLPVHLTAVDEAVGNFDRVESVSFEESDLSEFAVDDEVDAPVDVAGIMPAQLQPRKARPVQPISEPSIRQDADDEGSVADQNKNSKQRWKNLRPLRWMGFRR